MGIILENSSSNTAHAIKTLKINQKY